MDMEAHVFLDFKAWHVSTGLLYVLFNSTVAETPRYFSLEKVEGRRHQTARSRSKAYHAKGLPFTGSRRRLDLGYTHSDPET